MKSRMMEKRKKSTILVSRQTLNQAVQEGSVLAERLMQTNPDDPQLDQLADAVDYLSECLQHPNLDSLLDDATNPQMAMKVKEAVDRIAGMRSAGRPERITQDLPHDEIMASGNDNFMNDRDEKAASGNDNFVDDRKENAEPKAPETLEVPRLATQKKAAPAATAGNILQALPTDMIVKMVEQLPKEEGLEQNRNMQDALIQLTEILKTRPAAPAAPKPGEKAAPAAPAAVPAVAPPAPVAASVKAKLNALNVAASDEDYDGTEDYNERAERENKRDERKESEDKTANWFIHNQDTMEVKKGDAGEVPEIPEAHGKLEDHTGIEKPSTVMPEKFAGDISAATAVKKAESYGEKLKNLYLEAKSLTQVNDSRPVREAVEAIFIAAKLFEEACKTLSKQAVQQEQEVEAQQLQLERKKKGSLLFSLSIAGTE